MDLYAELIIEHSKRPQGAGLREPYDAESYQINPTCGDEVTLRLRLDGAGPDARVAEISHDAIGCSISVGSTSVLTQECTGHPVTEALRTYAAMHAMLTSRGADAGDPEVIGDGVAFAGVSRYPARVKCALLGWVAFTDALTRAGLETPAVRP